MATVPAYNYATANSPANISGGASESLFTAASLFADNPQLRRQFLRRHNYTIGFYIMLKELGLGFPLKNPITVHYEQDWLKQTFSPSVVSIPGGAGVAAVLTLSANDMYTPTLAGSGTQLFSYPQIGDVIELPATRVQVRISAKNEGVNPHTITVQPATAINLATAGAGATPAFAVAGRYAIFTNAFGEGTGQPQGRVERFIRYANTTHIVKSTLKITGSNMTNQLPFEPIEGMDGSYLILGADDEEKMHYDKINNALVFGQQTAGLTDGPAFSGTNPALLLPDGIVNYASPVKTTQGMVPFANANGQIYNHTPGSLTMDDFDAYGAIYERERVGSDLIIAMMGYSYYTDAENLLKDFLDNTCFNYAASNYFGSAVANSDPNDFFAYFGFYGVKKNGFRYLFKKMPEFTDPMGGGATGYGYPNYNIMVPIGSFTDGVSGVNVPLVSYEYKELGNYSREIEFWTTGGAGPINKTSEVDGLNAFWRSEVAGHFGMGNQWLVSKPVGF